MLVGYVSNERYLALSDVLFEFRGNDKVVLARSSISGAVYVDIEPGSYEVVFGKQGFGSKIVSVELSESEPYQFRLLADGLLGYMWPKCVQGGEIAEFRVHSDEEFSQKLKSLENDLKNEMEKTLKESLIDRETPASFDELTSNTLPN